MLHRLLLLAVLLAAAARAAPQAPLDADADLPEIEVDVNNTRPATRTHHGLPHKSKPFPVQGHAKYPSKFLKRPTVVIAAGPPRSGSTWQYALLHLIASIFDVPQYADSFPLLDSHKEEYLEQDFTKTSLLMKSHVFSSRYVKKADFVFTSHRDLRDVLSSMIRKNFFGCADYPSALFGRCRRLLRNLHAHHLRWEKAAHYDMPYEFMVHHKREVIRDTLEVLGIHLRKQALEEIVTKITDVFSQPHSLDNTTDPYWFVGTDHHSEHDEPGYFKNFLSSNVISCVHYEFGRWMRFHGYKQIVIPKRAPNGCTLTEARKPV